MLPAIRAAPPEFHFRLAGRASEDDSLVVFGVALSELAFLRAAAGVVDLLLGTHLPRLGARC